jgi:hypothetical protein
MDADEIQVNCSRRGRSSYDWQTLISDCLLSQSVSEWLDPGIGRGWCATRILPLMSDVAETRLLSLAGVNKRLSFREPRVPSVAHGQQSSSEAYQILQPQWLELNRSPELVQLSRDGGVKEVVAGDDRHPRLLVPSRARSRDRNPTRHAQVEDDGIRLAVLLANGIVHRVRQGEYEVPKRRKPYESRHRATRR